MKIKFLGTGSAFVTTDENFHSNILITKTGVIEGEEYTKSLLIDAGEHIPSVFAYYDIDVADINYIFITHNHSDHNCGLNYLGFKTYFNPDLPKPGLFADIKVMDVLWTNVLKGNMGSLNNVGRVSLSEYFITHNIRPRDGFQILNTEFYPVKLPHVIDDYEEVPAFGLKWTEMGVKFFLSGDVLFDFWRLMPFWEFADVIFQDCEFLEYDNSVHCQFHQLKDIPEKYRSKMWLYHYMLYGKTYEELNTEVKDAGFAGLIARGQEFDVEKIKDQLNRV